MLHKCLHLQLVPHRLGSRQRPPAAQCWVWGSRASMRRYADGATSHGQMHGVISDHNSSYGESVRITCCCYAASQLQPRSGPDPSK